MKYIIILASIFALVSYPLYAYFNPSLDTIIERQNQLIREANNKKLESFRQELIECIESASGEILSELDACKNRPKPILQEFVGNWTHSTGSTVLPSQWYTSKHSLVLTGSHDYRIYSDRNGAVWKNNNPSWITWGVSNTLKWLWNESKIDYQKWTLRPTREWWNYVLFATIEHWLRAKVISIRERWWKATVAQYLSGWWTDYVKLSFDTNKKISDLSDWEVAELFVQQIKKESPWLIDQLVKDWILVIN